MEKEEEEGKRVGGDCLTPGSANQWVQPKTLSVVFKNNDKQFILFKGTRSEMTEAKRRDSCFFPSHD